MTDEYINFLVSRAILKAMTLTDIQQATMVDTTLQCLIHLIQMSLWTDLSHLPLKFQDADMAELQAFQCVKEDLTVNTQENVILHGSRTVVQYQQLSMREEL